MSAEARRRVDAVRFEDIGVALRPSVDVPLETAVLCTAAEWDTVIDAASRGAVDRVVLGCDPGTQTGWALVLRMARGVVVPVASWVVGRRSGTVGGKLQVARAPTVRDHVALLRKVTGLCDGFLPGPGVVCEDWFAGPNPNTARDVARAYYHVEAAATLVGVDFRSVAHSTWKKAYLGRGNMRSDDALVAYAAKGYEAHPHVARWAGTKASALKVADDAAALGCAHWFISTEAS